MEPMMATPIQMGAPAPAPAAEPVIPGLPPVPAPAAVPDASVAPTNPAPSAAPDQTPFIGTVENPVTVPRGTQEKFKALESEGWKPESIEAYLQSIEDEATRQHVKDAIDGKKVYLKEAPLDVDSVDPFTEDEIKDREALIKDPDLLAARIEKMNKEFLGLADELEKAKNTVPEPMQRILQHPMVKAAVLEMERGEPFAAQYFKADQFLSACKDALQKGDAASLMAIIEAVPEAINKVTSSAVAAEVHRLENQQKQDIQLAQAKATLESDLTKISVLPAFKSNEPEMVNGQPNLNHPGVAFTDWLLKGLAKGTMTYGAITHMGGMDKIAMTWLANQKGGVGKMISDAKAQEVESWRAKMLKSRNSALAASQASTLNVPTGGVVQPLFHGVDISLAMKNTPEGRRYAEDVNRALQSQPRIQAEVAAEIRRRAGMTN